MALNFDGTVTDFERETLFFSLHQDINDMFPNFDGAIIVWSVNHSFIRFLLVVMSQSGWSDDDVKHQLML